MCKYLSKLGWGFGLSASVFLLSACGSSTSSTTPFDKPLSSNFSVKPTEIVLTVPDIDEREQYQMVIARLTQILTSEKTTAEQRAQILYQLGILYDRLGMSVTARNMFMNALIEVPDYAAVYNFIGSYLAAAERFSEAYDAFDAVLEIDPEESYAYFNRGIALYYGKRANLGIADLIKFYEFDKNDPFRIAWLYILEREVHGKKVAEKNLKERRDAITGDVAWGLEILDFMEGEISSQQLIDAVRFADITSNEKARRLCEAYFYMAKMAEFEGQMKRAYDLLMLCVATEVTGYLEYRYALMEIGRFERTEIIAKADQIADKRQAEREALFKNQTKEADKFFKELLDKDLQSIPSKEEGLKPRVVPVVPSEPSKDSVPHVKDNPVIPKDKSPSDMPPVPAANVGTEDASLTPEVESKAQEVVEPASSASKSVAVPAAKPAQSSVTPKAKADVAPAASKPASATATSTEASASSSAKVKDDVSEQKKFENVPSIMVVGPTSSSRGSTIYKNRDTSEEGVPVLRIMGANN